MGIISGAIIGVCIIIAAVVIANPSYAGSAWGLAMTVVSILGLICVVGIIAVVIIAVVLFILIFK